MKYLFFLGHPAHYHMFKYTIEKLKNKGNEVFVLIKKKDILEDLVKEAGLQYINILPGGRRDSRLGIAIGIVKKNWELLKFCLKNKPDIMIGSVAEIAHVGTLLSIPAIYVGEDDAHLAMSFARITYPFIDYLISPVGCNQGRWNKKTIHYHGYQKLAYLHPAAFTPSREIVQKYIPLDKPFFLLRFSKLKAYHDEKAKGTTPELVKKIVSLLEKTGNVYITSEEKLEPELQKYALKINPLEIHHFLALAQIYFGDSQSMAVEAAMLGTPSVRFNTWVGKDAVTIFEELEFKYKLTFGIHPSEPDKLMRKFEELLAMPNLTEEFQARRQKMLADKIDVTAFWVWFLENYPGSAKTMQSNPEYQYNFR